MLCVSTKHELNRNRLAGDRRPKLNREGRVLVLDSAQIKQVFAELDPPHRLIAQLGDYPASRVGEIVSLKGAAIIGQMVDPGLVYPSPLLIPMIAATSSILL